MSQLGSVIGQVGGWKYFVRSIDHGRHFEALRMDIPGDQLEDVFGYAESESTARSIAIAFMKSVKKST